MPSSISDSELKHSPHPTFTNNSPPATDTVGHRDADLSSTAGSDEAILAQLGYKQEFRREFTNLSVRPSQLAPLSRGRPSAKSQPGGLPLVWGRELIDAVTTHADHLVRHEHHGVSRLLHLSRGEGRRRRSSPAGLLG